MPFGGQCPPSELDAGKLDRVVRVERGVEKAQNQATKNITSEAMNKIMP